MRQYRIKKIGTKFFPQCKKGWKSLWLWEFFLQPSYMQFKNSLDESNVRAFCLTEEDAIKFIESDKKNTEIKYIKI